MRQKVYLLALALCLLAFISVQAEPAVYTMDWVYKLGDPVMIAWDGDAPEEAYVRVYHLDGRVDSYTVALKPSGDNIHSIAFLPASGDWLRINAFDEDGMSYSDTCTLVGLPLRKPFALQLSASALVARPDEEITLTLSPTGGLEPYQQFSVTCHTVDDMGYALQQLAAFEGAGPFSLNLAQMAADGVKTCLIQAQGTDSAGQTVTEELYLQVSEQEMAPLTVTPVLEHGPVVIYPTTMQVDIQGGVPPYELSTLWLVESAHDGISMPGEWHDAEDSSVLLEIEPGSGRAMVSVRDSAGHFVKATLPFLSTAEGIQPHYIRGVLENRRQGTFTESLVGSSPEHRDLLGRWVIDTPDWEGEALFLYDGTAYLSVFQNDLPRMNLIDRVGGVATVRDGRIEIVNPEGSVRELRYEWHGQTLKVFFNEYESAEYVRDTAFQGAPM